MYCTLVHYSFLLALPLFAFKCHCNMLLILSRRNSRCSAIGVCFHEWDFTEDFGDIQFVMSAICDDIRCRDKLCTWESRKASTSVQICKAASVPWYKIVEASTCIHESSTCGVFYLWKLGDPLQTYSKSFKKAFRNLPRCYTALSLCLQGSRLLPTSFMAKPSKDKGLNP